MSASSAVVVVNAATATTMIAAVEADRKKKIVFLIQRRKRNKMEQGEEAMALPQMINELVGKTVRLTTLYTVCKGKVAEIQGNWVKIVKTTNKGETVNFVNEEMITQIQVL